MDRNSDAHSIIEQLTQVLEKLDAMRAYAAAAHLDACLYALNNYFISEELCSENE